MTLQTAYDNAGGASIALPRLEPDEARGEIDLGPGEVQGAAAEPELEERDEERLQMPVALEVVLGSIAPG